ncbi:hypothetical protein BC938DRAFT_481745 [Jimgerdemannia flammicorona]|uniref:Uncharacterized protein n=1 Tax=Jimgerdemannia flammicorona TaxID=994334 RepID=A0A433QFI4_9FUNG|nr:hypothetical protein BC938DRAFT_481745 [Jimgerdemannia flammicorona]
MWIETVCQDPAESIWDLYVRFFNTRFPTIYPLRLHYGSDHLRSEARKEYKSVVSTFTETNLPAPQRENLDAILTTFNTKMLSDIAESRRGALGEHQAASALARLVHLGPFLAEQAEQAGLIDGRLYNRQCGALVAANGAMGLTHYQRVKEIERKREVERRGPSIVVGIVYLVGTIRRGGGTFGANSVVNALRWVLDPCGLAEVEMVEGGEDCV